MSGVTYKYSIHCLTDGSERTGGDGTLILSIETSNTKRKYALTGLSGLSSRLEADQRYPLRYIQAVFLLRKNAANQDGLLALFLEQHQAGVDQVSIVGPTGTADLVEIQAQIIMGKHRTHPHIRTCDVPTTEIATEHDGSMRTPWYQVFRDDHVVVHARASRVGSEALVYLFTLVALGQTLVVAHQEDAMTLDMASLQRSLPEFVDSRNHSLVLIPGAPTNVNMTTTITTTTFSDVYYMKPMQKAWSDLGLLVRARHRAKLLATNGVPSCCLPYSSTGEEKPFLVEKQICSGGTLCWEGDGWMYSMTVLENIQSSCVVGHVAKPDAVKSSLMKQLSSIWMEPNNDGTVDSNEIELEDDDDDDANDNGDCGVRQQSARRLCPHLLVLGTGCASPSPRRGSSGYSIFIANAAADVGSCCHSLRIVIECGEGFVTNLARHLPEDMSLEEELNKIKLIWISHAHLDHYGGLVDLVRTILELQQNSTRRRGDSESETASKAARHHRASVLPILIAPEKVLTLVEASLKDQLRLLFGGNRRRLYDRGVTHREFGFATPFSSRLCRELQEWLPVLQNVPVHHCPDAHALLLGLPSSSRPSGSILSFCYSGDTRAPCSNALIQRCRHTFPGAGLDFLLHEATFDDSDKEQAIRKKHSTVSEAIEVARRVGAKACLLTHFSQRYVCGPLMTSSVNSDHDPDNTRSTRPDCRVGFAVDGLWLPLCEEVLCTLPDLSGLIHQILKLESSQKGE